MTSFLASFLRASAFKTPLLRTLVPSVALAYGIQTAVAVPSIVAQTERFYDLSGSLTYLSCTALSLCLPVLRLRAVAGPDKIGLPWLSRVAGQSLLNWRQAVLSAAVGIWAARCVWFSLLSAIDLEASATILTNFMASGEFSVPANHWRRNRLEI